MITPAPSPRRPGPRPSSEPVRTSRQRMLLGLCVMLGLGVGPALWGASFVGATNGASAPAAPVQLSRGTEVAAQGGITLTRHTYTRGEARGSVWVARIAPGKTARTGARLNVVSAKAPAPLASVAAPRVGVAVNGGFYDASGAPMGVVKASGTEVAPWRRGGGSGVFVVQSPPGRARTARVVHKDTFRGLQHVHAAVQSIDRLVADGKILVGTRASPAPDARTGVCVTKNGTVKLAVLFDDRAVLAQPSAKAALQRDIQLTAASSQTGVSLRDWASILAGPLGCENALNLDGGLSTSMWARLGDAQLDIRPFRATINAVVATPQAAP